MAATASRDRRDFTDEEYARELEKHHVEIIGRESPREAYRRQGSTVKENPKSGVFRDFAEYGVHPARVVLLRMRLTIPFLVSSLSADQLADEITNQKYRGDPPRKSSSGDSESPSEADSTPLTISPDGIIRHIPSIDAAFELIEMLQKRKPNQFTEWTPPMQHYLSALNFYLYRMGGEVEEIAPMFLVPPRQRAMAELLPLIPRKIAIAEIQQRTLKDPTHWLTTVAEYATLQDIAHLIGELMTNTTYTSDMRGIIDWYRRAYHLMQIQELIKNVIKNQDKIVVNLRIRSLSD